MPSADYPVLVRASAHPPGSSHRRVLQRGAQTGELIALRPGVYVQAEPWRRLGEGDRYLLLVRAAVPRLKARFVVSHVSALAVHGLSCLTPWPGDVHVTDPEGGRSQLRGGIAKHAGPMSPADIELRDGFRVTSLARTCIDLALTQPFEVAVAAGDEALRRGLVTLEQLTGEVAERTPARRLSDARRVVSIVTGRSDSGGESLCRCRMLELGAPEPILQQRFTDDRGFIALVDFWFPAQGVVVEFDGDQKYLDSRYARGRSPADVVLAERKRERRLLAVPGVRDVVRVEWSDLIDPWRLRSLLSAAGVPVR